MNEPMCGTKKPSFARFAFDGSRWVTGVEFADGDGTTVEFAMPGLIDTHCRVWGELAYPLAGRPFDPIDTCRSLIVDAGVVAIRDVGNSLEARSFLESISAMHPTPLGQVSGPTIDCAPGRHPYTRLVHTVDDVSREVDRLVGEQVQFLSTGSFLRLHLLEAVVKRADDYGLSVIHRPGKVSAAQACMAGVDVVTYLPSCTQLGGDRPIDVILNAASLDVDAETTRLTNVLLDSATALVPLMHAWRRSSVLEEIVAEPRLDALVEIAPFHSYLRDFRGAAAMTFGKKYAKRYLGLSPMRANTRSKYDQGWRRLLELISNLESTGVELLPGSDATGLSLVPGFALHDELAIWANSGIATERILHLATQGAARALGLPRHGSLDTAPEVLTSTTAISPETPLPDILRSVKVSGEY